MLFALAQSASPHCYYYDHWCVCFFFFTSNGDDNRHLSFTTDSGTAFQQVYQCAVALQAGVSEQTYQEKHVI